MDNKSQYKTYAVLADTTRKWVTVMDAKAAFISTLNAGLLTFVWTGVDLTQNYNNIPTLILLSTAISFISLATSLIAVLPKSSLKNVFGSDTEYSPEYKPLSFYGFIASHYSNKNGKAFLKDIKEMDDEAWATEALEQHFIISHIVQKKANRLVLAGILFLVALGLTLVTFLINWICHGN